MFLDEMLRWDGFRDSASVEGCTTCGEQGDDIELLQCEDCIHGVHVTCEDCIVESHAYLPLHRIEVWNGKFFDKTSLRDLGLRVQLGHGGCCCPLPIEGPKKVHVFNISGVHCVSLDYCGCNPITQGGCLQQLLRAHWFPGTVVRPQTLFTFELLETFHELALQSKTTLYDFYHTIICKTDKSRCTRGHDPEGIGATREGELALECPSCPHPGKNLPDDWFRASDLLYVFSLFH
ncbi:hypothetical protein FA13DRAFT_1758289 [Coprinellus micaceus]|uniref:CxC2-like cysteine cluster KDZ transposase-associated domain-containing protein n=1 Tax=Coprinellus micaceus TaxID=71717 RepID=A0A4Y7SBY1_COPMI|nr:hypothetical protein FA13DRAFT_1758289 [Coprinellus micaceus]